MLLNLNLKSQHTKSPHVIQCSSTYKYMISEGQLQERKLGISKMGHQQSKWVGNYNISSSHLVACAIILLPELASSFAVSISES